LKPRLTGHLVTADMSQKVYRHLIEQRWRNEGALDLLVRSFIQYILSLTLLNILV